MGKLFGTDGVRGVANKELTVELAYKLGRAGAYILGRNKEKCKIVIGRDTRISGDMLEAAIISGICSVGSDVLTVGIVPTPAVAYLTRAYEADAGIVISASHNPVEYNGIKFFNSKGYKLNNDIEKEIEDIILEEKKINENPIGKYVGKKVSVKDAVNKYIEFLKSTVNFDFTGLKIAMDCGNGAAFEVAPKLFRELGADVSVINNNPNGININVRCGSTNPEQIRKLVLETNADIGFSFDGDADRLIAADEKGNIIDGDHIMAVCGIHLNKKDKLADNKIVATVMSNMGLDICLRKYNIDIVKTKVGDRYVLEEMLDKGNVLGGEQSGHIIFLEHNTTGDGSLSALQLASVVKETGKELSVLASVMISLPQVLVNAKVDNSKKKEYLQDDIIKQEIKKLEDNLDGHGRVLIRPSGTEPLVRVMIEGENKEKIAKMAHDLADLIEERLR